MPSGRHPTAYRTVFYDTLFRGRQVRIAAQLLPVRDALSAETHVIWLLVGETLEPREALAHEILAGPLQQEVLLVVLAVCIVWWGVRRGLRPLRQLSETVAGRGTDELARCRSRACRQKSPCWSRPSISMWRACCAWCRPASASLPMPHIN